MTTARCNPFGYATDAGPKHLMGGFYGPEYAGKQTVLRDGIHGPAVCTEHATHRVRMICPAGHAGPIMEICTRHFGELQARMSGCCTRCVWPDEARGLNEAIDRAMGEAAATADPAAAARLRARIDDLARGMDELMARGVIVKNPLRLVEIS